MCCKNGPCIYLDQVILQGLFGMYLFYRLFKHREIGMSKNKVGYCIFSNLLIVYGSTANLSLMTRIIALFVFSFKNTLYHIPSILYDIMLNFCAAIC